MKGNPLVSILVLSYNSAATIAETLLSIRNQTYSNIELILSDDASKDDTVDIVSRWRSDNEERFPIKILTVTSNTGIPANCNRAVNASNGEYIKLIAADDILLPDCIENFVSFFLDHEEIEIAYSNYLGFCLENGEQKIIEKRYNREITEMFDTSADVQVYSYLEKGINISPAVFMKKQLVNKVGGFIEKYKVFEDTPFFLKVLLSGVKIYHMDVFTVMYRMNAPSITTITDNSFFKTVFVDCNLSFRKEMVYPLYRWYNLVFWISEFSFRFQYYFTLRILKNKRSVMNNAVYKIVKAMNPYYLIKRITEI